MIGVVAVLIVWMFFRRRRARRAEQENNAAAATAGQQPPYQQQQYPGGPPAGGMVDYSNPHQSQYANSQLSPNDPNKPGMYDPRYSYVPQGSTSPVSGGMPSPNQGMAAAPYGQAGQHNSYYQQPHEGYQPSGITQSQSPNPVGGIGQPPAEVSNVREHETHELGS